jgi:hypothetical protein
MSCLFIFLLFASAASVSSSSILKVQQRVLQQESAPSLAPSIVEDWDPFFGYTDANGNIVEVDSLPPNIAAEQAAPIASPVDDVAASEAPSRAPITIDYWDPVFGYTDENGNIVEVDSLPPNIAAEQAAPIASPVAPQQARDVVASEAPSRAPITVDYWDPFFGYTDANGNIVEVDSLPPNIAAEQAAPIASPVDDVAASKAPSRAPITIDYWDPVFGYTDENGNIVEVDSLPPNIAAEQAAPIASPVASQQARDVVVSEAPSRAPITVDYWDPVFGYTDENGNIVEVDSLPPNIAAEQAAPIASPVTFQEVSGVGISEAPSRAPITVDYWDPVFGYTDANGNIVEVDSLPPNIAAEQAAPIASPVEFQEVSGVVVSEAPSRAPITVDYWDPVFGYTDENGNTVEVDSLPPNIEAEQAAPIASPLGDVASSESPSRAPIILDYWHQVFGYRDENGTVIEVDVLPPDITQEQAGSSTTNSTPLVSGVDSIDGGLSSVGMALILVGSGFMLFLGVASLMRYLNRTSSDNASPVNKKIGKKNRSSPEALEPTESSESHNDDEYPAVVELIRPVIDEEAPAYKRGENISDYGALSAAIANMRRLEKEAMKSNEDGMITI